MKMEIINKSQHILSECHAEHSEGMNVRVSKSVDTVLKPVKRAQAKAVLYLDIPVEFVAKRKPRSGPSINHKITVIDEDRTIDKEYTGKVSITRINLSDKDFVIKDRERI
jgi:dUTP pyrophosphatase